MSSQILKLTLHGKHACFHIWCATLLFVAGFIVMTAVELGPFAPLVIAEGLYIAAAAGVAEALFAARAGLVAVSRWAERRAKARHMGGLA